jgi:hypothetical protein
MTTKQTQNPQNETKLSGPFINKVFARTLVAGMLARAVKAQEVDHKPFIPLCRFGETKARNSR